MCWTSRLLLLPTHCCTVHLPPLAACLDRTHMSLASSPPTTTVTRQYLEWAGLNETADFFSHPEPRRLYRQHVAAVLSRINVFTGIKVCMLSACLCLLVDAP